MEIALVYQGQLPVRAATRNRVQALSDRQSPVTTTQNQQFWHIPYSFYRAPGPNNVFVKVTWSLNNLLNVFRLIYEFIAERFDSARVKLLFTFTKAAQLNRASGNIIAQQSNQLGTQQHKPIFRLAG